METLIIGLAGLLATVVSSGLGLYFTARARTAPMRHHLYARQLDLAEKVLRTLGRARLHAVLLAPDSEYRKQAREGFSKAVQELSRLTENAAVLFPTELYGATKQALDTLAGFLVVYDKGHDTSTWADTVAGHSVKVAVMTRALLGIDELSDESVRLFSKTNSMVELDSTNAEEFLSIGRPSSLVEKDAG